MYDKSLKWECKKNNIKITNNGKKILLTNDEKSPLERIIIHSILPGPLDHEILILLVVVVRNPYSK